MKKNLNIKLFDFYHTQKCNSNQQNKNYMRSKSPLCKNNDINRFIKEFQQCTTPNAKVTQKQAFQFKSPKYKGIIQKKILQRLAFYKKKQQTAKKLIQVQNRLIKQEQLSKQLQNKPQINQTSKILYQKIKQQRNLSPNILQRFQSYQVQRANKQAQYELIRNCGYKVQNDTLVCRNILQEKNLNRQKSKSCKNLNNFIKPKSPSNKQKMIKATQKINKTSITAKINENIKFRSQKKASQQFFQQEHFRQSQKNSNLPNQMQKVKTIDRLPFQKKTDHISKWKVKQF